jgi:hypothetical protein
VFDRGDLSGSRVYSPATANLPTRRTASIGWAGRIQ